MVTVNVRLNPRDSIMTNAEKLADIGGGGTACSAPLRLLNHEKARVDMVIIVSDNESWADQVHGHPEEVFTGQQAVPVFRTYILTGQTPPPTLLRRINI